MNKNTGYKDRNGNAIKENDIVVFDFPNGYGTYRVYFRKNDKHVGGDYWALTSRGVDQLCGDKDFRKWLKIYPTIKLYTWERIGNGKIINEALIKENDTNRSSNNPRTEGN